ncbi:MAG: methyltransferase domain-containing protein [Chloroflexi bacterium]|nr:methyltransferase domain-containing protein [Chloroflexota bacterium]
MEINEERLNNLLGKMVTEMGAAVSGLLVIVGDKLGLYKELAAGQPLTSEGLAERTGTTERLVREWLAAQASSGYIEYNQDNQTFSLTPEQQMVFAVEDSPVFLVGGFLGLESIYANEPKITEAFRTGDGVSWGDHSSCLFCGTERFFRSGYRANLVPQWLPQLDGVVDKLQQGVKIADIGCGHGASTLAMAAAFPQSQFYGFDFHPPSIEIARGRAQEEGLSNVSFEVATAKAYPGSGYDFVAFFDCLHDIGDPVGALQHVRETLTADGTLMLVEPFANDTLTENLNPVGRVFYAMSTAVCIPNSLSQEVGLALGAQAGESRLRDVVTQGGFSQFRRATETPFNLILEAKL